MLTKNIPDAKYLDVQNPLSEKTLECKILSPKIDARDIGFFVSSLNGHWGDFFSLDENIFKSRLESGHLFIAAYAGEIPLGLLETISIEVDESKIDWIPEYTRQNVWIANQVCDLSPQDYVGLTENGLWKPYRSGANVLWLVDITVPQAYWRYGIGSEMVRSLLRELLNRERKIEQLKSIDYVLTFTPSKDYEIKDSPLFNSNPGAKPHFENSHGFHEKNGAFYTWHIMRNARPGHKIPHVAPMCYLVPGFEHIIMENIGNKLKDASPLM